MPTPMYHLACGGLLLWRVGKSARRGAVMSSRDTVLADGSMPVVLSIVKVPCGRCGAVVTCGEEMTTQRNLVEIGPDQYAVVDEAGALIVAPLSMEMVRELRQGAA